MDSTPPHASLRDSDWEDFAAARTAEARARAWLALICGRLPEARAGVVLVENLADRGFAPLAAWPRAGPELGRLGAIVESALQTRQSAISALPEGGARVAYPVWIDARIGAVVALETAAAGPDGREAASLLREIHWGAAWLLDMLAGRERAEAIRARERLGSVLETLTATLRHGQRLQQALFDLANALCRHLACARVAIGLERQASIRLAALSDAASFDRHAALAKNTQKAMDEAHDAQRIVQSPPPDTGDKTENGGEAPMHDALRAASGAGSALSYPLIVGARCIGVITLERENAPFTEDDRVWLDAFGALASPIVELRRMAERGAWRCLADDLRAFLEKLFGPRHLTRKVATAAALGIVALMTLTSIDYRVSAKTVIEGEVQRVTAAPFDGFIGAAHVRAGDTVQAGQLLARLDDRDLRIEEARWSSERDQYENRLREATANHDLTAMEVVGAQLRQASAQLALATEKIARARLTAPFDGIVVSGDLSQQIGAPVKAGDTLFEIAPLMSYRVILQVDEREIRHVRMDQPGQLVMTGIAGEPMPFKVVKLTPVATAQDGRNFFRVEAALADASPRLRPGMEGVGKIEAGRRSSWWVMTHGFIDWFTLWSWTWMP
ncbi:MAG: HlyD family efflux transporter periplasmic adaptor subunit [Candidatus Accumulibacter sp.]|jgi:RND family efflux transporter MFP subunit|nr:HlyD family efflux transporter periplasmic adaptor subunit [Accumulibacter sp.]